jgi:hypothetical protein
MPLESKRQQRFMFKFHPDIAKRWAKETDFSKLPEKVSEDDDAKKKRKSASMAFDEYRKRKRGK